MVTIERNIKKRLKEALAKTGDRPEDVRCKYIRNFSRHQGGPLPMVPSSCSAADLPEGELIVTDCNSEKHTYTIVETDTGIKIEISSNPDPS